MESQNTPNKKAGIAVGVVVVLAVVAAKVMLGHNSAPAADENSLGTSNAGTQTLPGQTATQVQIPPADTAKQSASVYKDGTYSATGSYMSPGGEDQIAVTLTLKNDIITAVSVTPMPGDRMSAKYQGKFVSGYQALVVGKNIADVNLTKVSGSSLTPAGFDNALAQIEAQAKA